MENKDAFCASHLGNEQQQQQQQPGVNHWGAVGSIHSPLHMYI